MARSVSARLRSEAIRAYVSALDGDAEPVAALLADDAHWVESGRPVTAGARQVAHRLADALRTPPQPALRGIEILPDAIVFRLAISRFRRPLRLRSLAGGLVHTLRLDGEITEIREAPEAATALEHLDRRSG